MKNMPSTDDATTSPSPVILVVMGVSGSGKTTVATALSERLGWPYEEGDSLHPKANVEKMASGHPLNDDDRWPWLEKVTEWAEGLLADGRSGVITCSALKRSYRDLINRSGNGIRFVYLQGEKSLIAERLAARRGHYMPASLLDSQFADLEEPAVDEPAIRVHIGPAPNEIVDTIMKRLKLERPEKAEK
jgi:carbohydrate kinase (thermoresistant glucokinase family)